MPQKIKYLIILAVLAIAAVLTFYLYQNSRPRVLERKELPSQVTTQEVPQTNPFEEAKTNPFKDIKTNPFDI